MQLEKKNIFSAKERNYYRGTYKEILADKKTAKNFFVFDILPPVKIEKVAKEILGLKEYKTKQAKNIALGWRAALASLFIIFILTGITPFGLIRKGLSAFGSRTIKLNYYSENCFVDQEAGSYKNGWWNTGKINGEPSNAADSEFDKFSDENSGFYNGGLSNTYCSDFKPAMKDKNIDEAVSDTRTPDLSGNVDVRPDQNSDQNIEVIENNDQNAVEVIDKVFSKIFQPMAAKTKNLFGSLSAWAEESDQERLKKIGELSSVKINFSLAINEKLKPENLLKADLKSSTTPESITDKPDATTASGTVIIENPEIRTEPDATASDTPFVDNNSLVEIFDKANQSEVKVEEFPATDTNIQVEQNEAPEISPEQQNTEKATTSYLDLKNFLQVMEAHAEEGSTTPNENTGTTPASSGASQPIITAWYSVAPDADNAAGSSTEDFWHELDTFYLPLRQAQGRQANEFLNKYFSYDAPFVKSQGDLNNLKIKLEGRIDGESKYVTYVDSVWAEAVYEKKKADEPDELALKMERWKKMLKMVSLNKDFKMTELPVFKFQYEKKSRGLIRLLQESLNMANYWDNVGLKINIAYQDGTTGELPYTLVEGDGGEFEIRITGLPKEMKPGQYRIFFTFDDSSDGQTEQIALDQEFSWGVLAINFNKTIYRPAETAYLQMAALDNNGHTLCNTDLSLEITAPDGGVANLSSQNGLIINNPDCGSDNVIDTPDYYSYYSLAGAGIYNVRLSYNSPNGTKEITDQFEVRDDLPFEIERIGPTRIYPRAEYGMNIKIRADQDFSGDLQEVVPETFKISNFQFLISKKIQNSNVQISKNTDSQILTLNNIKFLKGEEIEISYNFDAPDISPAFYLLGPLQVGKFAEARKWQIASDALEARANTAQFIAGTWSADGNQANGQNSDTDQTLPSFNFRLGENSVTVKNAYIVFELQFDAYVNNGIYTGYSLYFDSCQAPCAPNALGGAGRVTKTDATVLAYDETNNSNQVRLLFDVTNEAQLAAYGGTSTLMSGQVGYNIRKAAASASIANAKATLFITYTYNPNTTENYTNTVTYPLESIDSLRMGTKATSTANACILNSTCPLFGYNMLLSDYTAASSSRAAQWFTMYGANDRAAAAGTDIKNTVNIQGNDTESSAYWLEANAAKTEQSVLPAMWFPSVAGYAENTSQTLEYRATSTNAPVYYLQGGEVTETYIASTSFPTKTRTVAFPLGELSGPTAIGTSSATTTVYFPENGSATGTVTIKKAWVRLITGNNTTAVNNTRLATLTGSTPMSASQNYAFNPGVAATIAKTSFNIIHVISSTTYSELEKANSTNGIPVGIYNYKSTAAQASSSAVLMITYDYTDEANGYLTSLSLYGGQSAVNPGGAAAGAGQSTTTPTANSVLPETLGTKTIRAAAINASYLGQDFDGTVGTTMGVGANLSTGAPSCTNFYRADASGINTFVEFYKNVTAAMNTTNNQAYNACFTNNGPSADPNGGAKMNGILFYTYSWDNKAPTSTFLSMSQEINGSRLVDISFQTWDQDRQDLRVKLEYDAGADCDFAATSTPTISTNNASTTASNGGDPQIDNGYPYQIGTSSAYILTTSGSNNVNTVWEAGNNLNNIEGTYCLRLMANDFYLNQATSATSTIYIDAKNPTAPGSLTLNSRTGTELILNYGATSTETNFKEYKIFYKQYDGTPVTETNGILIGSSTGSLIDENLGDQLFYGMATTSISGLSPNVVYSIVIYAYDDYGNRASSSQSDIITNDYPIGFFNGAPLTRQKSDGLGTVDVSIEIDDLNNSNTCRAKIEYAGADCDFSSPQIPALDPSGIQPEYGSAWIDNDQEFQIGTSTPDDHWIWTAPGQNTIDFDWLTKAAMPAANGDYCLRLTVNDLYDSQLLSATTTVLVDNLNPDAAGNLTDGGKTVNSITLAYGLPGDDDHFSHYKIFYKKAASGATESDTPHLDDDLDDQNYGGTATTTVSGLDSDSDYVFNIWAYDLGGNKTAAAEVVIRTNSSLTNQSLSFVDPVSANFAVANGTSTFTFRAVVNEATGWENIASTTIRLADSSDSSAPYSDLVFKWDQNTNIFSETGADALSAVALSDTSSSTCSGITCTLDFKLIFNHLFQDSSANYTAELYSENDLGYSDLDSFADFYQVKVIKVKQIHYRWRYDNGKE